MSQNNKPIKYFLEHIMLFCDLKPACRSCKVNTIFSGWIRVDSSDLRSYQCQSCGKLKGSDDGHPKGTRVALDDACECGGQFRRDKNVFCPNCRYRQSEENKFEKKLYANPKELKLLRMRHGVEEMAPGFFGENTELEDELEEVPERKKLYDALQEITKYGETFSFGFESEGKESDYTIGKGLSEEMESELIDWIDDELAPQCNYYTTDYELTSNEDGIEIDCISKWNGSQYDRYKDKEDLFTEEIVELLLPEYDFENVDLNSLSLEFNYTFKNYAYQFEWNSDFAKYYDEEKNSSIEIPINDIKLELEPLLSDIVLTFEYGGSFGQEGLWSMMVEVDEGRIDIEESFSFRLSIDIDDY
jgi:hypothetical protein